MNIDKMTDDEVAIHSALIQWFEYDAILFYNLSKPACNYAIFEYWLRFYNVMRNTPKDTREVLFKGLKSHIKKFKSATGEDKDFLFVKQLPLIIHVLPLTSTTGAKMRAFRFNSMN